MKDDTLVKILNHLSEIISSLHKSYSLKVWKLCLDKVLILYIECLLNSANKLKTKDITKVVDKIVHERDICKATFKVSASTMEASIKIINQILDFFDTSPALAPMSILELRRANGTGFNMTTVKALLNLRVDMTSAERSSTLSECKEVKVYERLSNC